VKVTIGHSVNRNLGINVQIRNDLIGARLDDEDQAEDQDLGEAEPLEPPELEDLGDSAAHEDDGAPPGSLFDRAWTDALPLVSQLPRRLRPPVRYRIDSELSVHELFQKRSKSESLERAVAEAIAEHLRRTGVKLEDPGDWCRIAAIGRDIDLVSLIPAPYTQGLGQGTFKSVGNVLKDFAVELPNGEVVTPQALIDRARRDKLTTRAAALRWAARRPAVTPDGDAWAPKDWDEFEVTQSKKSQRAARARGEGAP